MYGLDLGLPENIIDTGITEEGSLITCRSEEYSPIKATMLVVGDNDVLKKIAKVVTFDLSFTDQLAVDIRRADSELSKKKMVSLFDI